MSITEEVGAALRELREHRGMTQRDLGKRLGTASGNLSNFEQGKTNATLTYAAKVATALNAQLEFRLIDNTLPGEVTVQQVVAEYADSMMHPAAICRALEHLINQELPNEEIQLALKAARAILCRLDPDAKLPGLPKWV